MSNGVRLLSPVNAALGEGLCWDVERSRLWMVDIVGKRLFSIDPADGCFQSWSAPEAIGWAIPRGPNLLVGLASGVAKATLQESALVPEWVARIYADRPEMRLNDAKADRSGAIWAGSMNRQDESRPDGSLYRIAPDGSYSVVDGGYSVANGPALSQDERLMLHTDSGQRIVYAFDLDVDAGCVSGKRVWRRFTEAEGHPDGMCFDAEGCVWIAHWGAGMVCRYAPDGSLVRRVAIPAVNVTDVCFFGTDLDRLAVTTASQPPTAPAVVASLEGAVFEVAAPGVRGLA